MKIISTNFFSRKNHIYDTIVVSYQLSVVEGDLEWIP